MSFRRSLEMSVSREDFFRLLPFVVGPFEVEGDTARWSDAGRRCTIRVVPLPDRRLGRVTVSRQSIEIDLEGCSEPDGEAFMARFRRTFLRGGG